MPIDRFLFVAVALLGATHAPASERLLVQVPAVLDPGAPIVASVQRECGVELLIGSNVLQKVGERIGNAFPVANPAQAGTDRVVLLTITSVQGVGGGGWSGSKAIAIRADLMQGGQVLRSGTFRRGSRGGLGGAFSGTCAIMERIAIALGADVANWLRGAPVAADPGPTADGDIGKEEKDTSSPTK